MARLKVLQVLIFVSVWVFYAATYLIRKPLGVIKVGMEEELNFSKTQLGWMDTAVMLPYSLVQMSFGTAADNIGPRRTVTACLALTGMSMMFFGSWSSYPVFLLLLLLSGVTQAPAWPACCKCLAAWFPDKNQNTVFGFMSTSAYGGSMIATAIAVYLYNYYGWRFVYLPLSLAVLGLSCVAWFCLKMPEDYMLTIPGKTVAPERVGTKSKPSILELWRIPMVSELAIAMMCLKLVRYSMYLWLPVYLMKALNMSPSVTGILSVMFDIGGMAGSAILGYAADKHSSLFHTWLAVVGSTLCFIFFLLTATWGTTYNAVLLLLAGACICGPDALLGGSAAVAIGEKDGRNAGAAVAGLVNGFGSLGGVLEGPLVGCITEMYGWNTMFLLIIALLLIGSFSVLRAFIIQKRQIYLNNVIALADAE
ncbi:hypothetical protein R5R35_001410 [Gryllus longicercus]|uniref:Major facilitator superfamily (MFS) profile domain-containing protein n=1 Tax=Gryllus longicercus TaxID=2509291 RepID=A0AAN9VQD3_9ORTH